MQVEVAIFWEADPATLGGLGRIIPRIPPKSRRRASLAMVRGPSFDGWELPLALPSTACATFRETRFVQCELGVTRFRHVLSRIVGTYASREAGERLCLRNWHQGKHAPT
jgi:hypothetical protein